jgi:chromosome partitioning protein
MSNVHDQADLPWRVDSPQDPPPPPATGSDSGDPTEVGDPQVQARDDQPGNWPLQSEPVQEAAAQIGAEALPVTEAVADPQALAPVPAVQTEHQEPDQGALQQVADEPAEPQSPAEVVVTIVEPAEELVEPPAPFDMYPIPRIMAIANQKGGVGKTTTTVNLGACLAEIGFRTLIIDLDPQGNASTGLGIDNRGLETSMYHVIMHEAPLENCIEPAEVKNLFVAPASLDLAGTEIELVPAFSRENRLKRAIEAVQDDYDYILIDCPPSLGLLTVNGLTAATEVLVPIQCEYYALEGLGQLLRNVDLVKRNLNPTLTVSTIVCVMYDARTKLADQVVKEVREHFGDKVMRTVVPRTVRLSEAPSFGQPIITFDSSSRGAVAYRMVAKEVSAHGTPRGTR